MPAYVHYFANLIPGKMENCICPGALRFAILESTKSKSGTHVTDTVPYEVRSYFTTIWLSSAFEKEPLVTPVHGYVGNAVCPAAGKLFEMPHEELFPCRPHIFTGPCSHRLW